ncbi:MAG: hypothetical protein ACYC25_10705, partial [Paludibacter sp.]
MWTSKFKIICFLFVFLNVNVILLYGYNNVVQTNVSTPYSFIPTVLSPDMEIGNPNRGYYQWGDTPLLSSLPQFDANYRFSWRQIESSKDVYDFSIIDTKLAALKAGQRFSFRI